jgi:hypothetical protein
MMEEVMKYLHALLLAAFLITPTIASTQGKKEAKKRFSKGVELFKKGDNEGALVEFKAAYNAQPHFKVRYNIGMTLYNLNRYVEAEEELKAYITEGGDDVPQDKKTTVQSILYEIASYIGSVSLNCDVDGAQVFVDGEYVATLPLSQPFKLDVGEHIIEVKAEGYSDYSEKVSMPGAKDITVHAELSATEPATGIIKTPPPPGTECTYDGHCRRPKVCYKEKCMSKASKRAALNADKYHGKELLIPGAVLASAGGALFVTGLILLLVANQVDGAPVGVGITGITMLIICPSLSLVGMILAAIGRYRLKRWKSQQSTSLNIPAFPYLTPIPGGGMVGVGGYF